MAAKSYKDPEYARLSATMEAKYGLPKGLLHDVVTKGERSNADQVSEAGARTVFQITPGTRKAALDKFGVDAYLSAENAAEVAARLLKESLDRNGGDVKQAVGEYHGGTDRKNWGPRTRAYIGRVTGSTFDRVKARRDAQQAEGAPSIAKVYEAYKAGKLSPEERRQFVADVTSGAIMLPRGASLGVKPTAATLPAGVVEAYSSHSEMTDAERDQLDADIAEGLVQPPKGMTLRRPAPRTAGERLGMGVRDVMTGVGGLVDIVGGPLNTTVNTVAGTELTATPGRDLANMTADALDLAKPGTPGEKLASAVIEGGTQGLVTAGAAAPFKGAQGVGGAVARGLADNPAVDIAASAAGAGGMEKARQEGAGPLVQIAAGLAAGAPAGVAARAGQRVAARYGPKAAKVVETTPREVLLDEAGELTEEGREVVARQQLTADEVKGAYDEAAKPDPEPRIVRTYEGVDYDIEVLDPVPVTDANGVPHLKVRGRETGEEGFVPAAEVRRLDAEAPAAPQQLVEPAAAADASPDAPLPASAAARTAEAASEGIDLTRGQATKSFEAQSAEQDIAATQTPEGQKVRDHFAKQAEQIKAAVDRFQAALGDQALGATERGQAVKDALRELRDNGKAGVTALYAQAREAAEQLGEAGSNLIQLDTGPLLTRMREIFIDEGVDDGLRRALKQQAAKYGLIGENPRTVEGETTVTLRDANGEPAGKITFTGPRQRLEVTNAENLRQFVNAQFQNDKTGALQSLKPLIDNAVEAAIARAAEEGPGDVGRAFQAARAANVEQMKTFKSGDVVQDIIDWKKGQRGTDKINPEDIFRRIFAGGREGLTNLKKVKAVLLSKPTEKSQAAWKAIQAHAVADIFNKATVVNANLGEAGLGAISGAKLNSEIARFGADKLKVLLAEEGFNQLMKLKRVISDATIPLKGTINPSGSGHVMARFFARQAQNLSPVAKIVPLVRDIVKGAEEYVADRQVKKVVEDVTTFTPEKAAANDQPKAKADPLAFVRNFLRVAGSDEIIQPIIAAAANEDAP